MALDPDYILSTYIPKHYG